MKYIPALDGLRAIAVLAVLVHHGSYGHFPAGYLGVDLFFVLSGFLITRLLQLEWREHRSLDLPTFYCRRALRLLPALAVLLVLSFLLWPTQAPGHAPAPWFGAALPVVLYYANFVDGDSLGSLTHCWSLSLEEQFYFLWPIMLTCFILRLPSRGQLAATSCALLSVAVIRALLACNGADMDLYRLPFTRADSLLSGAVLAMWQGRSSVTVPRGSWSAGRLATCALAMFFLLLIVGPHHDSSTMALCGFTFVAAIAGLLVLGITLDPASAIARFLSIAPLKWVGRRSYGIYLFHYPIFLYLEGFRVEHNPLNFVLVTLLRFVLSLAMAELSYSLVEQPILRLRNRLRSRPAAVTPCPQAAPPDE